MQPTGSPTCLKVSAEPWGMEMNRPPWPVSATGIPDPGGIAAISRWLSVSDTTGIKGQVLPTLTGSQPSALRSQASGLRPQPSGPGAYNGQSAGRGIPVL